MYLVDSHCHLDGLDYAGLHTDLASVLQQARMRDVKACLAVSTTLPGFKKLKQMVAGHDEVFLSCGVHPLNLDEVYQQEELLALADDPRVIALGETGLDYYYQKDNIPLQQNCFRQHIQVGRELNKPVIVHTRDARTDTLAILKEEKVDECGGVLHCFTEDCDTAKKLLDIGFYISFSGIVTFRNADALREAARYVPLDRMLVETDSPYLAPVPHRGKENQPAYVRDVAEYLAVLKRVELETFAEITTKNFSQLFKVTL
ncbi:metal-dependent hydrolase [Jinshanibacter sp. LJY008]|uniref:Metal-dependent hydrolase n=1 Tax=Limnobaculum eriocheiris TaxID=2897391 RepID=A0A9X1MYV6_9GAMM|nr:metal-dependent hydrolase [Limnobaculum eriocheiris]MCD1126237.1 metal-dependent hydrolase [Limnobaculum eriocheiris]